MMLFIKSIHTTYSFWLIIICLAISFGLVYLLYRKDQITEEINPIILWTIKIFRFIFIFLIAFLLLKPLIKSLTKNIEEPILIFAQDNSASIISNEDSLFFKSEYQAIVNSFLAEFDNLNVFSFGFDHMLYDQTKFEFKGLSTNISNLFEEINNKFFNKNIGALVVATDGIYNEGLNPFYYSSDFNFPVYFIALGDTAQKKDLFIKKVINNNIAFLNNKFPVKIEIGATNLNDFDVNLDVIGKNGITETIPIKISDNNFVQDIDIELLAEEKGLQEYTFKLTNIDDEQNIINNSQSIQIDIIDTKTNILLLYNSPHPDVAAIQSACARNENYNIELSSIEEFKGSLEDIDLVILHQLPSVRYSLNSEFQQIKKYKTPVLYITGSQTSIQKFNNAQSDLRISRVRSNNEEIQVAINKNFNIFRIEEETAEILESFPPLNAMLGSFRVSNQNNILAFQKIKNIKTAAPLIYFTEQDNHKYGFILGEGVWKWKLHDFKKHQNHDVFNEFITKTVQYLTLNVKKERLNLNIKKTYAQNEAISIDAELYNKNFELVNDPELKLFLESNKGLKYEYTFNKTIRNYDLKIANLPEGKYAFKAEVRFGNEIISKSGEFIIYKNNIELLQTRANHKLLYLLADKHNGEVFNYLELDKLKENIKNSETIKPIISYEKKLNDLINIKALLIILILFISLEWFVRKYFGGY